MKKRATSIFLTLLLLWEVLYYLGWINPRHLSHPLGALQVLVDPKFLKAFGVILSQIAFSSLIGGTIGLGLGALISQSSWVAQLTVRFLRIGLWVPFLVLWAIPPLWSNAIAPFYLAVGCTAVVLFTCYHFLTLRIVLGLRWKQTLLLLGKFIILQALLFSLLFSQVLSEFGWIWLFIQRRLSLDVIYSFFILLMLFIFLLDRVFQSDFDKTANTRAKALFKELASASPSSLWGAMLLVIIFLIFWQFFSSTSLGRDLPLATPLDVLQAGYRLLASGTDKQYAPGEPIWRNTDIVVSVLEVIIGLTLGGCAALLVSNRMSVRDTLRSFMLPLIPLTFAVPIFVPAILPLFGVNRLGLVSLSTILGVGLLTFFPFIQVLWGMRNHPFPFRVLLATDDALPFAFVGMLFGELSGAAAGLAFFIAGARSVNWFNEAMAASLITICLFIILSSTLRILVKHLYFPAEN